MIIYKFKFPVKINLLNWKSIIGSCIVHIFLYHEFIFYIMYPSRDTKMALLQYNLFICIFSLFSPINFLEEQVGTADLI